MTIDETLLSRLRDGDDLSARMEAASSLEAILEQNEEQARRVERLEGELRDLLAVIHRDGGHYATEHGNAKAYEDGLRISSERIAALSPFEQIGALLFARDLSDDTPVVDLHGINGHRGALTRGMFKDAFRANQPGAAAARSAATPPPETPHASRK